MDVCVHMVMGLKWDRLGMHWAALRLGAGSLSTWEDASLWVLFLFAMIDG